MERTPPQSVRWLERDAIVHKVRHRLAQRSHARASPAPRHTALTRHAVRTIHKRINHNFYHTFIRVCQATCREDIERRHQPWLERSGRWKAPHTPQQRALACDCAVAGGDAIRAAAAAPARADGSGAARDRAGGERPAAVLVLFSGPAERDDGLPAMLRKHGIRVVEIDVKVGGAEHDLTRPDVRAAILKRVQRGEFQAIFMGTPCESFSVAHRPRLRSRHAPWGLDTVPSEWRRYLLKHNQLAAFTIEVARTAIQRGVSVAIENPADRGEEDSPAYWHRYRDHGSLWRLPQLRELGLRQRTFSQCAFNADVQKLTTIAYSAELGVALDSLGQRQCTHGFKGHKHVAHGRDEAGRGRANMAAAYPADMCAFLAAALAFVSKEMQARPDRLRTAAGEATGGRVADGIGLSPYVASQCAEAQELRPKFASLRNLEPASRAALSKEALPGNLHSPMEPAKPAAARAKKGKRHPTPIDVAFNAGAEQARRPAGAIAIHQLFLGTVYTDHVTPWLRQAEAAALALERGERPPDVPTVVIPQEAMQPWARGTIWDCADPSDCAEVVRSTRDTVFAGSKQINRAAFREAAAQLGWHDEDIVSQVGEGGIEVATECPLDTVLAWHHKGFAAELDSAKAVIEADMAEEWVTRPVGHLPYVPCRVLPRNVVMQSRTRVKPDGSVEHYSKPRVSQDASDGAEHSVNYGVPASERTVTLPTAQAFGRALAICDTAGTSRADEAAGERPVRAVGYAIDVTSAFRFCPLQRQCVYTQCFAFWTRHADAEGRVSVRVGICADTRMGFGGCYAPNRFERVSLLAAAHVQAKQDAFDDARPPPACVRRWSASRAQLLADGGLVHHTGGPSAGAALRTSDGGQSLAKWTASQTRARYLQVFIDDYNGVSTDDDVEVPTRLDHIVIEPAVISALGGVPARSTSRAHAHARLAIEGLGELGLDAAPSKTMVGNPIISLGLQVDRDRRVIDCPRSKQIALLEAVSVARLAATAPTPTVDTTAAGTTVGRLCNLSQVLPEMRPHLEGGYAVTRGSARAAARGRKGASATLTLRTGSRTHGKWIDCLDAAASLVGGNAGVDLAPALRFHDRGTGSAITCTTDASGHDGVGGYVFSATQPEHVWVVSEPWPEDIRRALSNSSTERRKRHRSASEWALSMPAAELFGCVMVPRAAIRAGMTPGPVYAVGDCDAAASALNAAYSKTPQMQTLLRCARRLSSQWLAVTLPREANLDADRLSHPQLCEEVISDARAAQLHVTRVRLTQADWNDLREAIAAGSASSQT